MKRILWFFIPVLVVLIVTGVFLLGPILYPSEFQLEYSRRFDPEVFSEETKYIIEEMDVKTGRYENLAILIQFQLEDGEVDYEVVDPNGEIVLTENVVNLSHEKLLIMKPIRGVWKFVLNTTEQDRGVFRIVWVDEENLESVRTWTSEKKSGSQLNTDDLQK
ncbi:MAG: hypothetical protein Q4G61_02780 [Tissierellia bacterium]|nr:hypothetical protein [Tissierellia bacterium]